MKIGSTIIGHLHNGPHVSCCALYGFKVQNVTDTLKWKFFYDPNANGGWIQVGPAGGQDANFGRGVPMGETARRGGAATGAADEHKNLKRVACEGCGVAAWTNNVLHSDGISNWHSHKISDDHYEVHKDH